MKILLCIIILTYVNIVNGQTYHPLIENNDKIWEVYSDNDALGNPYLFYTDSIKFISDTIIGTKNYKKCIDSNKNHNQYTGWHFSQDTSYLREDSSKKVFLWEANGEYMLYNFSLQINDYFITYNDRTDTTNSVSNYWQVTNIDSIIIGSEYRKRFTLSCMKVIYQSGDTMWGPLNTDIWIEGIGSTYGLFDRVYPGTTGWDGESLSCFFEDGILIYNSDIYNNMHPITQSFFSGDCLSTITNITTSSYPNNSISFINGYLFLNLPDNKKYIVSIYNSIGQNILTKEIEGNTSIDLNNKGINNDILFYKLKSDNEFIKTGKIILLKN
jgi:hypothetical protein